VLVINSRDFSANRGLVGIKKLLNGKKTLCWVGRYGIVKWGEKKRWITEGVVLIGEFMSSGRFHGKGFSGGGKRGIWKKDLTGGQ